MKHLILVFTLFIFSAPVFSEKAKVMLVQTQCESIKRNIPNYDSDEDYVPPRLETNAFIYRTNSSVEIYSDSETSKKPFSYKECISLKPVKKESCGIYFDRYSELPFRYLISFEKNNTVLVTDAAQIEEYEEFEGPYKPDSFVLSKESYKALKYDLLNVGSVEAAISFLNSATYFWEEWDYVCLIAEKAKEYQILSGERWQYAGCGNAYKLHMSYTYKNGILESFTAEDKDSFGCTVFKKTLISDTEEERKYSRETNEYFENDSYFVLTQDKQSNIWRSEGEAMNNWIWDIRHCHFPPQIVYMNSDELKAFLDGEINRANGSL